MLFVAQLSPPSELVAARRTEGFAKYLARLGHPVTVLSSVRSGRGPVQGAVVVRTRDLAATRLNWRTPSQSAVAVDAPTGKVHGIEAHAVPDVALLTWLPYALTEAVRLARHQRFDCVITSSPPTSVHLLGPVMQRLGMRWIADFRDGWTFQPPRPPWPLAAEARIDAALERALVTRADGVIGVTSAIVDDFQNRLGVRVRLVSNGYQPDERQSLDADAAADLLRDDRHSLVHTGRAAISERTPDVIFDAVRHLMRTKPDTAAQLEIVFAGSLSRDELVQLSDPALARVVRGIGSLDRRRALALQQAADSLLVITTGPRERSLATGKLFEYLTAGRPILVVGSESEAAKIVAETGTGLSVPAGPPEAVAEAIERVIGGLDTERDLDAVSRYSWENLARHASRLVEEVCDRAPRYRRAGGR